MKPTIILLLSLLLLSCKESKNEQLLYSSDSARAIHKTPEFDRFVGILRQIDRCDSTYADTDYTPADTRFHLLRTSPGDTMLFVETERSCGWTGSCGLRLLIIEVKNGLATIAFEECGFLIRVGDSTENGVRVVYYRKRGYGSGELTLKCVYDGKRKGFRSKTLARDDVPISVIRQLPLQREDETASNEPPTLPLNFEIDVVSLAQDTSNRTVLLVTVSPVYLKKEFRPRHVPYWIFVSENREDYAISSYLDVTAVTPLMRYTEGYADLAVTRWNVTDTIRWSGRNYDQPSLPDDPP